MSIFHRGLSGLAIFGLIAGMFPFPAVAAKGNQQAPKLMNFWLDWQIPEQTLTELAKWDIVVLDFNQQQYDADRLRRLKQLNPGIKILAHIDSSNILAARFVEDPKFPGYKLARALPESWYIHRGATRASIWPASWMLNVTSKSPTDSQGRRWQDYLPEFIEKELWSTGLWDGIFLDNAIDNATWFAGKGLDITGDGIAEDDVVVDREWKAGWDTLVKNLRNRLGPSALIMGNGSVKFAPLVNGILFENFPRYGWVNGYRDYQTSIRQNAKPTITAFNSNNNNIDNAANYKLMRFTLATALLGDGYYSFDEGDRGHTKTWWYDEYDATLGAAQGAAVRIRPDAGTDLKEGVWRRDYERGAVLLNSTNKSATIDLSGVYERLRGSQDPIVNSGALETAVTLGAQEGIVLYRRSTLAGPTVPVPSTTASASASSTPAPASSGLAPATTAITGFKNGEFVRVYRPDGTQPRTGFFVQQRGVAGGASVLTQDVDRDGKLDTIAASAGTVTIAYGKGGNKTIRPFGSAYRGAMSIAAGNTDRDAPWELVIGGGRGEVRVVELDGVVKARWLPYPLFRGSISVAIGDVDGDGLREIVTAAGPGGGPHVRIFKTDGKIWHNGWFAFDTRERGGAFVALGDLDSDGKDEVIVGSGQGTVPRVRTFTPVGERTRDFALSSEPGSSGVRVSVSDTDGDGKLDILASGIKP